MEVTPELGAKTQVRFVKHWRGGVGTMCAMTLLQKMHGIFRELKKGQFGYDTENDEVL